MVLILLALMASPAVSEGAPSAAVVEEVPLYSPEEAWQLAHVPVSRMLDGTTCERIAGIFRADGQGRRQVVRGGRSALFRKDNPHAPFMRVETREDGVYVARFPATPGEVIVGRVYSVDPRTKRFVYGPPLEATCRKDSVSVGEPEMTAGEPVGK